MLQVQKVIIFAEQSMSNQKLYPDLLITILFRCIDLVVECTVSGQAGDGTKRGTCHENFNCHANGDCKPCKRDGSCSFPGLEL